VRRQVRTDDNVVAAANADACTISCAKSVVDESSVKPVSCLPVLRPDFKTTCKMSAVDTECEEKTEETVCLLRNLPPVLTNATLSSEGSVTGRATSIQDQWTSVAGENAAHAKKLHADVCESEGLKAVQCVTECSSLNEKNCNIIPSKAPNALNQRKRPTDAVVTFRVSAKCSRRASHFFTSQVRVYGVYVPFREV
jgi:hypothetical protein